MTDNDIYRYGTVLQRLPKPKCVCFYNGTDKQPEEKILRLSEAFGADDGDIEVRVRMMNINYGHNCALMEACRVLNDYALLIDRIRANQKAGMNLAQAVDAAIDEMPDDSLLEKFLLSHRAEVKGMYLTEYDEAKERMHAIREGRDEGRAEGRNEEKTRFVSEMLRKNLPLNLIEEISQLSKDVIYSIAQNIGVPVITA